MLGDMTVSQRHTREPNLGSERLALFGDSEAVLIELALIDWSILVIVDVGFNSSSRSVSLSESAGSGCS